MNKKHNQLDDDSKSLRVRRGRVESVDLYEIKDTELDALEKGTPAELQFNFAVFLLSLAFAAISSLMTATFQSKTIETLYIVVSVVGVFVGVYLLIAWYRTRSEVKELCLRIRQRIPPDAIQPNSILDDVEDEPASAEDHDISPPPKG